MKAKVSYCESTDKTHMIRLAFPTGSAHFEIPKEEMGFKPEVGDEVEIALLAVPKPKVEEPPVDLGVIAPPAEVEEATTHTRRHR